MNRLVHWDFVDHQPGIISARQDRVELAVHEAGHAVFAAMLGMAVPDHDQVTIRETETGAGGVTPMGRVRVDGAERIVVAIAGHAAVECLMPGLGRSLNDDALAAILKGVRQRVSKTPAGEDFDASGDDEEMALAFLAISYPHLSDEAVIEHYRDAEALARGWVKTEPVSRAIEAVMTVLIHHSAISGLMVRQVAEGLGLAAEVPAS